jgi:hypothetical protein
MVVHQNTELTLRQLMTGMIVRPSNNSDLRLVVTHKTVRQGSGSGMGESPTTTTVVFHNGRTSTFDPWTKGIERKFLFDGWIHKDKTAMQEAMKTGSPLVQWYPAQLIHVGGEMVAHILELNKVALIKTVG